MSRIGNRPIIVPKAVTLNIQGASVTGKGPQGQMTIQVSPELEVKLEDGKLAVTPRSERNELRALQGAMRTTLANMIQGLQTPYVRELEIQGVGFKAQAQGQKVVFSLGYSHPISMEVPAGVAVKVTEGTLVTVSGADKQLVGQVCSIMKGYYPAEPYKGKGVRYKGEHIRRKAGKAVA